MKDENKEIQDSRPKTYSKFTNTPYYQQRYALELQMILDTRKPDCDIFLRCHSLGGYTVRSLYTRVYQSFRYLLDNLDPEGKYLAMWHQVEITKHDVKNPMENGIIIHWKANPAVSKKRTSAPLVAEEIKTEQSTVDWKEKLEHFIDNAEENDEIVIENVHLSSEEFEGIQAMFAPEEFGFVLHPKSNTTWLKVIKNSQLKRG